MKQSLSHFSSFSKWPSLSIFFNSSFTPDNKCIGTLHPFPWTALKGERKCLTYRSFGNLLILLNRFLNFAKSSLVKISKVFDLLFPDASLTVQIATGHFFFFTYFPSFGRLSLPRVYISFGKSCNKETVSWHIHPLDWVGTTTFPKVLIVLSVKPQYNCFVRLSTAWIFTLVYRSFNSYHTFCFKKLTGLAESTGMFIFIIISHTSPVINFFFVSNPF